MNIFYYIYYFTGNGVHFVVNFVDCKVRTVIGLYSVCYFYQVDNFLFFEEVKNLLLEGGIIGYEENVTIFFSNYQVVYLFVYCFVVLILNNYVIIVVHKDKIKRNIKLEVLKHVIYNFYVKVLELGRLYVFVVRSVDDVFDGNVNKVLITDQELDGFMVLSTT